MKNIEHRLVLLEAQKRSLKYKGRSYMSFGINGEKEFTFIREGSHYIPQAIDSETYTAFYPPDSKKKSFAFTHRNKQIKHGLGEKLMTLAKAATWIFGLLFLFAGGYFMFQAHTSYTDNEIMQAKLFCVEAAEDLVQNNIKQGENLKKIYDEVASKVEKPQVIVEGVAPQ